MTTTTYGKNYERTKDLRRVELKKEIGATIKKEMAKGGELYELLTNPWAGSIAASDSWFDSLRHLGPPLTPAQVKKIKVTLKEDGGRTCSSTRATIRGFPEFVNPAHVRTCLAVLESNGPIKDVPRFTMRASAFKNAVDALIESFNFDGSDSMTDYFHVRFYLSVEFDHEEEADCKEAIVARCSPLRAARAELLKTSVAVVNDWRAEHGLKPGTTWVTQSDQLSDRFKTEVRQKVFSEALGKEVQFGGPVGGPEFLEDLDARLFGIRMCLAMKEDWTDTPDQTVPSDVPARLKPSDRPDPAGPHHTGPTDKPSQHFPAHKKGEAKDFAYQGWSADP